MFKRKIFVTGIVMSFAGTVFAFAEVNDLQNGKITAAEHTPAAFDIFYIRANADVKIHLADTQRIVINAPANFHKNIRLQSKKNELEINVKGKAESAPRFSVDVYTPPLAGAGAAFTAKLEFDDAVSRPSFEVGQTGSAQVRGTLNCKAVDINTTGNGTITLTGSAVTAKINMVGAGLVDVQNFKTVDTAVNIIGDGKILTWTTGNLAVTGVGNGSISYRGNPIMDLSSVGQNRLIPLSRKP